MSEIKCACGSLTCSIRVKIFTSASLDKSLFFTNNRNETTQMYLGKKQITQLESAIKKLKGGNDET